MPSSFTIIQKIYPIYLCSLSPSLYYYIIIIHFNTLCAHQCKFIIIALYSYLLNKRRKQRVAISAFILSFVSTYGVTLNGILYFFMWFQIKTYPLSQSFREPSNSSKQSLFLVNKIHSVPFVPSTHTGNAAIFFKATSNPGWDQDKLKHHKALLFSLKYSWCSLKAFPWLLEAFS